MPSLSDQYLASALRAHEQGDLAAAISAYQQALVLAPDNARASGLLGTALLQRGEAAKAVPYLEAALAAQRHNTSLIATLAQAYFATNQFVDAADLFRKATRAAPAEPQFQLGLANSLAMQGHYAEARRLLERLLARDPAHAMAWFNLGNVLRDLHALEAAMQAYRKTLALAADFVEARNALGSVLHSTLQFAEAEHEYRRCLHDAPQFAPAYQNLASVLIDQGQFAAAESVCRELIRLDPTNAHNHGLLADTLNAQGRLLDAARHYGDALQLAPDDAAIRLSYATKLCAIGDIQGGLQSLRALTSLTTVAPQIHQTLSTLFLAHGFLAEGWAEYRQRPAFLAFREKLSGIALIQTLPDRLKGLRLCVLREQGLGDEIFFLRYARVLTQRGAHVTYRSSRAIASLIQRLVDLGEVSVVIDNDAPLPACDAAIMVGDLPHALALQPADAPAAEVDTADAPGSYPWRAPLYSPLPQPSIRIAPLPERLALMRTQLAQLGPPPYLGITWRGGTPPSEQGAGAWLLYKTLDIARLGAALKSFRGTFIALQRNPAAGEITAMEIALGTRTHDLTLLNNDLESMLALLSLIDEYVGVSNTNMHLRAAAGKAARVLVPAPAEWRWMADSARTSPWFPDFAVYRQSVNGAWDEALDNLNHDLGHSAEALKR